MSLKYEQKDVFEALYLYIVSDSDSNDEFIIELNATDRQPIIIALENKLKYGGNYTFYIKTEGCNKTCSAKSNSEQHLTGIYFEEQHTPNFKFL